MRKFMITSQFDRKVDHDFGIKNKKGKNIYSKRVRDKVKIGSSFVSKIINLYGIQIKNVSLPKMIKSREKRGCYNLDTNIIDIGNQFNADELIVHEMGHFLEDHNQIIHQRCRRFFNKITKNRRKRSLKQNFPDDKYDTDEYYIPANIKMPHYATKCMDDGTELFSKGMEMLYKDPVGFSKKYPEYFTFIISTIKKASTK